MLLEDDRVAVRVGEEGRQAQFMYVCDRLILSARNRWKMELQRCRWRQTDRHWSTVTGILSAVGTVLQAAQIQRRK
jgi:hypothetical protein